MQDESTVQHRFVQIHQTCTLAPDQKDKLWSILSRPGLSSIAVSNACHKTVDAVKTENLGFQPTLQQLQNLVLTTSCQLKISIFLRSITQILLLHAENPKMHAIQLVHTSSLPGTLHPFVVILRQRPELYHDLLSEIDFLLGQDTDEDLLFETMLPFFDAIFLLDLPTESTPFLTRITTLLAKNINTCLFSYLLDIINRYPKQRAFESHLALLDVVISFVISSVDLHEIRSDEEMREMTTVLLYQLLERVYDAATYDRPMLPYLERIPPLLDARDLCSDQIMAEIDPHLLWSSFSYLLLKAQTVDDQEILLKLMQTQLARGSKGDILLIAYLPLFQTLSEITTKESDIKSLVLGLLDTIAKSDMSHTQDVQLTIEKITDDVYRYQITGVLAHSIPFLCRFLEENPNTDPTTHLEQCSSTSSISHIHTLLFNIPYMFNSDPAVRHVSLTQVAEIVSFMDGTSYKFPVLLVLLHLTRNNVTTPDTLLYIFHHIIPLFVDRNDPTTTSKVLQIVLSVISGDTAMSNVGVKVLTKIYERHPRIWPELKRLLADWVLRRKSASARLSTDPTHIQVELTMLTTMRDLCRHRPRECAQDVLPMLLSILQACQDLSFSSLSIIVETVCACVSAGMAEARSIWIIAIQYIAKYAMDTGDNGASSHLLQKLCGFFAMAGDKDEVSDMYVEFKESILNDYLAPLTESKNTKTQYAALTALSHFSATDIMTLLPEKAKDFISQIISSGSPNQAYSGVLVKLMSHELDHMRRGLFQEDGSKKNVEHTTRKITVGDKEHSLGGQFISNWENARTMPGLRTGHALAILTAAHGYIDRAAGANTMETITKTKWYRCMATSIADIGLTDHLLIRVTSLDAWIKFFQTMLVGNEGDIETKASLLLCDLSTRLERSTVPGTTSNILLAIGGLITTVHQVIPAFAASHGTQFIETLTSKYIMADGVSPTLMSEEIQFAARFVLGHVSVCVIVNEKNAAKILDILLENAVKSPPSSRSIDAAIDLVQFANGYAAGRFTASLATWPTKTTRIESLAKEGIDTLLEHCNSSNHAISESTALGIMMGWASLMDRSDMKDVLWFAREMLKLFTEGKGINKGIVLGAPWICAYGTIDDHGEIDEEIADVVESAAAAAANDNTLVQHFYHFSVPLAKVARLRLITDDQINEASDYYSSLLLADIQLIQYEPSSSHRRLAALFSLSTLLGVDYLNVPQNPEWLTIEARKYSADTRNPVLDVLASTAGLTEPVGNLKSGRIAAVVSGKVVQAAMALQETLRLEQSHLASTGQSAVMVAAVSSEPKTYARLNHNTSYLRAVFDSCVALTDAGEEEKNPEVVTVFLTSLRKTPGPLPPVNWFSVLMSLTKISSAIRSECLLFASTHASTSLSLLEFVLLQVSQDVQGSAQDLQLLLVGEAGLGKMLELSGLPANDSKAVSKRRGMDAVTKKMSVSEMRCLELFETYAKSFKGWSTKIQTTFLSTLSNHLPKSGALDDTKVSLVSSLQSMTMYNITLPLLQRIELQSQHGYQILVQRAVECGITEMGQLSKDIRSWLRPDTAYGQVVAVTEVCRLGQTDNVPKYLTDVVTQLLLSVVEHVATWDVLAEAIKHHALTVHDRFAWVVRLLDVLIVIGSLELQNGSNVLRHGVAMGLRCILTTLWWGAMDNTEGLLDTSLMLADTGYLLARIIALANDYKQQQQQIIKRIFKLVELATEDDQKRFFIQVLRDCPEKVIQDEHQMAKWIRFE